MKEIERPLAREPVQWEGPLGAERLSDPLLEFYLLASHVVTFLEFHQRGSRCLLLGATAGRERRRTAKECSKRFQAFLSPDLLTDWAMIVIDTRDEYGDLERSSRRSRPQSFTDVSHDSRLLLSILKV